MNTYSTYKTPVIPASGVCTQSVTGTYFFVSDAAAPFRVAVDGGEPFTMKRGRGFEVPGGEPFRNLTFFNDTSATLQVEYYAGNMRIRDDNQVFTRICPTRIQANGGTPGTPYLDSDGTLLLTATTYIDLPGLNALGFHRKQIIITNLDSTLHLRVRKTSSGSRSIATIFPLSAWTMETDAALALHNHNGSSVSCQILETFYTDQYDTASD